MHITLRQLRAFITVAELGSFVDAARSMHLSAPALSILVAELEGALGFRLFERTTRRVRLSATGEQYLQSAQRVLSELESSNRLAHDLRTSKLGIVRIATTQLITWTLIPGLLSAFREARPDIRVEPIDSQEILNSVDAGKTDLAIYQHGPTDLDLRCVPLFASRLHLACRADQRRSNRKRVRWTDLNGAEPLIVTNGDTLMRVNATLPKNQQLTASWQVQHAGTALALAASGLGSAICAGYARPIADMHKLCMSPLEGPTMAREISMYTSRRRAATPATQAFSEFLVMYFGRSSKRFIEQVPDF